MSRPDAETERQFVKAFLRPGASTRWVELLGKARRRAKVLERIHHLADLDPRFARALPADDLLPALRQRGAPELAYVLSPNRAWDARRVPLVEALDQALCGIPMLLSCLPGVLGAYVGEMPDDRFLLHVPPA